MIASDWGRWLIDEIESAQPTGLSMWYLGCNGLVVKTAGGTTAYIDPYLGLGDPPRTVRMLPVPFDPEAPRMVDAIFITHEHTDHLHGPTQAQILENTGATLYAPPHSVEAIHERGWFDEYGIDPESVDDVTVGDAVTVGDLEVGVHPCNDPDATDPVSYRFKAAGNTIIHAADGRPDSALAEIGDTYDVDVTFAAVGSRGMIPDKRTRQPTPTTWYNDANDVVEMGQQLQTDRLVPTHWDMWKGLTADPTGLVHHCRSFEYPRRLEILEIGDRLDL